MLLEFMPYGVSFATSGANASMKKLKLCEKLNPMTFC